jgi:hypothetical protein
MIQVQVVQEVIMVCTDGYAWEREDRREERRISEESQREEKITKQQQAVYDM